MADCWSRWEQTMVRSSLGSDRRFLGGLIDVEGSS